MKINKLVSSPKKPLKIKKLAKKVSLPKETALKPVLKAVASPELEDARERAAWKKEKREYWSTRFRKILAEIALRPKVKKSSFL
jgi:hypothetical protein